MAKCFDCRKDTRPTTHQPTFRMPSAEWSIARTWKPRCWREQRCSGLCSNDSTLPAHVRQRVRIRARMVRPRKTLFGTSTQRLGPAPRGVQGPTTVEIHLIDGTYELFRHYY